MSIIRTAYRACIQSIIHKQYFVEAISGFFRHGSLDASPLAIGLFRKKSVSVSASDPL